MSAWFRAHLAGALLAGGALRLAELGRNGLWLDELFTARAVAHPSWAALLQELAGDVHPPGYFALLRLWSMVAGTGDAALRLPSALAGLVTVGATALAARKLAGNTAGSIAAWMAAVGPFAVTLDREARGNAAMAMLATLGVVALLSTAPRRWWAYTAVAVLLPWVHVFGWFVLLGHTAFVVAEVLTGARERAELRPFGLALVAAVAGFAPWLSTLAQQTTTFVSAPWYHPAAADSVASLASALLSGSPTLVLVALLGTGLALARGLDRPTLLLGAHLLALVLVPHALALVAAPVLRDRNVIALVPVLLASTAAGLSLLRPAGTAVVSGLWVATAAILAGRGSFVDGAGESWREVAAKLAHEAREGDLVLANHPNLWRHYLPERIEIAEIGAAALPASDPRRLWLAQAHRVRDDWVDATARSFLLVDDWRYPGARLALYDAAARPLPLAYDLPGSLREGDTIHFYWGATVHSLPAAVEGQCALVVVGWSEAAGGIPAKLSLGAGPYHADVVLPANRGVVRGPRWPLAGEVVASIRFANDGNVGTEDRNAHLARVGWDCQSSEQPSPE